MKIEEYSMRKYVLLWFIMLIIFNCSKEKYLPLDPEKGNRIEETVVLQSTGKDFYYSLKTSTGSSTHLLLGQYNEEYTSRILLQFGDFPDSVIVESAQIILYAQDLLGDSSSISFDAKMYKFDSSWDESDTINWANINPDLSNELSSTNINSISDSVVFNLDPYIVNQWSDPTLAEGNYGVWIDCNGALFIKDFYSRGTSNASQRPSLRMIYTKEGQRDTTILLATKDAFVLEDFTESKLDTNLLYIGKGIAFHSYLKFDVIDSISDSTATINKAELQLIINRENSFNDAQSVVRDLLVKRVTSEPLHSEQIIIDSNSSGYTGTDLVDTMLVDITSLVQVWTSLNSLYPNYGILLQSFYEEESLARIAFYSSRTDSIYAPKLIIKYTLPPSNDYY